MSANCHVPRRLGAGFLHRGGTIELCPEANEVTLNGQLPCNQEGVALSSFLCPANHANLTVLCNL